MRGEDAEVCALAECGKAWANPGKTSTLRGNIEASSSRNRMQANPSAATSGQKMNFAVPPRSKHSLHASAAISKPFWRGSFRPAMMNHRSSRPRHDLSPHTGFSTETGNASSAARASRRKPSFQLSESGGIWRNEVLKQALRHLLEGTVVHTYDAAAAEDRLKMIG